jgi:hypothetical protein
MFQTLPHRLYPIVLGVTGLGWLVLFVFPRRSWANFWAAGIVLPFILGALYTVVFVAYWFRDPRAAPTDFLSLNGLRSIFQNSGLLLAGFIDLTGLPLIIGAWMTRKAGQTGLAYFWLLPCLLLTAACPSTGFVLFAIVVTIKGLWPEVLLVESQKPYGTNRRVQFRLDANRMRPID